MGLNAFLQCCTRGTSSIKMLSLFTKQQNCGLVEIESICRRQIECDSKTEISFGKGRKHRGEKEKMLVTSIFSFSHNVFQGFCVRVAKSRDCLVNRAKSFIPRSLKQVIRLHHKPHVILQVISFRDCIDLFDIVQSRFKRDQNHAKLQGQGLDWFFKI